MKMKKLLWNKTKALFVRLWSWILRNKDLLVKTFATKFFIKYFNVSSPFHLWFDYSFSFNDYRDIYYFSITFPWKKKSPIERFVDKKIKYSDWVSWMTIVYFYLWSVLNKSLLFMCNSTPHLFPRSSHLKVNNLINWCWNLISFNVAAI